MGSTRRPHASSSNPPRTRRSITNYARHVLTGVPDSARTRAIVDLYAGLAPPNEWVFGRFGPGGEVLDLIFSDERNGLARHFDLIRAENALRSRSVAPAPYVTRTMVPPGSHMHCLTVRFAHGSTDCGMLLLLRDSHAGTFGVTEIDQLEERVTETSSLLYRSTLLEGEQTIHDRARQRVPPSLYVLNPDYTIALRSPDHPHMARLLTSDGSRFIPVLEEPIRRSTVNWRNDAEKRVPASLAIVPVVIVRIIPVMSSDEYRIGIIVERYRKRNPLNAAAVRFGLSPRELEVVALLLQGMGTAAIAQKLLIAISTVQDYVRRILTKTHSSNRAELISKVLGWRGD